MTLEVRAIVNEGIGFGSRYIARSGFYNPIITIVVQHSTRMPDFYIMKSRYPEEVTYERWKQTTGS